MGKVFKPKAGSETGVERTPLYIYYNNNDVAGCGGVILRLVNDQKPAEFGRSDS